MIESKDQFFTLPFVRLGAWIATAVAGNFRDLTRGHIAFTVDDRFLGRAEHPRLHQDGCRRHLLGNQQINKGIEGIRPALLEHAAQHGTDAHQDVRQCLGILIFRAWNSLRDHVYVFRASQMIKLALDFRYRTRKRLHLLL